MSTSLFSRKTLDFLLFEVFEIQSITANLYFEAHDLETFKMVLDSAIEIAEKIVLPSYVDSDRNQPELHNGEVKVHQGVHQYFKAFADSGLLAATFPFEYEGQQLPKTVFAGVDFIIGAAHNSFLMFTDLVTGCANLVLKFGTDDQKQLYIPALLSGKWGGTMCLTEPQAGSALSEITTTAVPQPDGTYKLKGQKIFISAGDHDITDNIIHLVLARIEGALAGTKGISLFIVPKNKLDGSGSNDVNSIGIYHKMGQKATPALHLSLGDKDNCTGFLLGEANKGLPQMFQMMNGARLGVGLCGTYTASAAYYHSLQYAQERVQGRSLTTNQPTQIINHPDVQRMLLTQKAFVEGSLAFHLQCYYYLDLLKTELTEEECKRYDALLELLTPVAKTYGAEMGITSVNQGLQILGGYGYTEDFPLEQLARDVRITSIYEGTTGIQSLALLGREITRNGGVALQFWKEEVKAELDKCTGIFDEQVIMLQQELLRFKEVTQHLLSIAATGKTDAYLADATLYMEYFGLLNAAWQWLKMARVAYGKLIESDTDFYTSKVHTMKFFFKYELSKCEHLAKVLTDHNLLTINLNQNVFA